MRIYACRWSTLANAAPRMRFGHFMRLGDRTIESMGEGAYA
ncbi:hypothetical protein HMPREF0762_00090 [Slackia exigua ATCC 700122]|uniref:Uncharacterized protein n=1 Tax=Slackia exigua (strain ATCC 700122 / DSM 15923 / CIP 105133 / JCM 11022 / KCTC 5966 / S-7) TaxID=649764 RepID=D0WE65_SLAES|nr:hypothetical protein HMPREF0762_00090 [Slackia exigua ATCC 700122]